MGIVTRTPKEQEEYGTTGYPKKEEEESKVSGLLGGLLGMGTSVAGMIPSLLKGPQDRQLKKIQAGGGAGAAMARQTGSEAAARIVGASTAQPSSGRGGALTEGLRVADQAVQRGAQQAAITGAREGLAATQMLRGNEMMRRDSFKQLGAGVGQGLAGIGGMLAAARDQGDQQLQEEQAAAAVAEQGGPATATMLAGTAPAQGASAQMQATRTLQGAPPGPPGILPGAEAYGDDVQGDTRLAQEQYPGAENKGVAADLVQANTPQAKIERDVDALVTATREKRQAADVIAATSATPSGTPPPAGDATPGMMSPPEYVEDYLYNLAMNYDPRPGMTQGMRPDLVAEMLLERGFVVDWARLGTVEPAPQQAGTTGAGGARGSGGDAGAGGAFK